MMEFTSKGHDVTIQGTNNGGYIVKVGCATMVYAGAATMLADLCEYLNHREDVEKQYAEHPDSEVEYPRPF